MPETMELDSENVAVVVVDMQNSFLKDGGSMERLGFDIDRMQPALPGCETVIDAARSADVPVIFTRYVLSDDYSDGGILVKLIPEIEDEEALREGSWDIEIVPELSPGDDDVIIDKNRPSAFFETELDEIVEELDVDQFVVCGVTTNCCVETTVRDASQRDIETFVVEDATEEWDDHRYSAAIESMDMLFAEVVSTDDVVSTWEA